MTAHQAMHYCRERTAHQVKHYGTAMFFRPSTAALRRILHDRATPKGVKTWVYTWLLTRRHARS